MELVDRYLQAVKFWLPRHQKDDILAELSADLQSQIEDREDDGAASKFEPEVFEGFLGHMCTVSYIVCHTYCVTHSSKCQEII